MQINWLKFFLIILLVFAVAAVLANNDHFLTRSQLEARGIHVGTPLWNHWGVRGDILLLPFALGLMFIYSFAWKKKAIALCSFLGIALSWRANFMWGKMADRIPNCFAHNGRMTAAGWVHLVFMAGVFAAILLFYFATYKRVWRPDARWVWLLLNVQVFAGVVGCALYVHDPIWNFQIMGTAVLGWILNTAGYLHLKYRGRLVPS